LIITDLEKIQQLSIDCTSLIAKLNVGQSFLFSAGLSLSMLLALKQVMNVKMTVGDLIAVNGMLLQLAIPFNNLGYTCKIDITLFLYLQFFLFLFISVAVASLLFCFLSIFCPILFLRSRSTTITC
jgi:ABC-type transport system involved in Fe-S cluster assembly fused permease/ATPase subunit